MLPGSLATLVDWMRSTGCPIWPTPVHERGEIACGSVNRGQVCLVICYNDSQFLLVVCDGSFGWIHAQYLQAIASDNVVDQA
jgi:hypothetical protein